MSITSLARRGSRSQPQGATVGYARVSTDDQADHGYSLPTQQAKFRRYCAENNLTLGEIFVDVETGRRDDRRQYQRMVALAREGKVRHVVVQLLDRFGRNTKEILRRYWELEDLGVTVHATDEDLRNRLLLLIKAWSAEEESRRIGHRVREVMIHLHRQGKPMQPAPYGYRLEGGRFVIDPEAAAVVRRIVREYLAGWGVRRICMGLNRDGIPSPRGARWAAPPVTLMLRNRNYTGDLHWADITVSNTHEPIVDRETFDHVQEEMRRRTFRRAPRDPSRPFPLAGLLRCTRCGRYLHTVVQRQRHYQIRQYRCPGIRSGECDLSHISANVVEAWLLDLAKGWRFDESRVDEPDELENDLARLERTLADIEEQENRNHRGYVRGNISEERFEAVARDLRREREETQDAIAALKRRMRSREDQRFLRERIETFGEFWAKASAHDQRAALRLLIDHILVSGPRQFAIIFQPGIPIA